MCFHDAGCDFGYRCEDDICQPIGHVERRELLRGWIQDPDDPNQKIQTTMADSSSADDGEKKTSGYVYEHDVNHPQGIPKDVSRVRKVPQSILKDVSRIKKKE